MSNVKNKDWLTTLLLAIFLGWIGFHRFYVGKIGTGILMLLLSWTGISTIWAIFDIIKIATGKFKDGKGNVIQKGSTIDTDHLPENKNNLNNRDITSNNISVLQQKAESGDAESMLQLAMALNNKKDTDVSNAEVIMSWLVKAAKLGNAQAQYQLWDIYDRHSEGAPDVLEEAFYWLKEAAQNGHTKAKDDLAFCYLNGTGTSKDYEKAVYWMEQASNDGNVRAKTRLGAAYIEGIGVSADKEKGLSLLKEAASLGDETAKEALKNYSKRELTKKEKLIRIAIGFVIGSGIGVALSMGSGYWHIGLLIGAYLGIGIGSYRIAFKKEESGGFWAAAWDAAKNRFLEAGFGAGLLQLIFGPIIYGFWILIKLCFKVLVSPFIAVYKLVTNE